MDREPTRGFQYHASLPYDTESSEEFLAELYAIVHRIEDLYGSGGFQEFQFGTGMAPDAGLATRDLMSWTKRKLDIPLELRLRLTEIYSDSCFAATEPTLMIRYGSVCAALWKGHYAKKQLLQYTNVVDWKRMSRAVRNVVILDGPASSYKTTTRSKDLTPESVILEMAKLFRYTVRLKSESDYEEIFTEILSFLGPDRGPPAHIVLNAFEALVPYDDPKAVEVLYPIITELWPILPPNVAAASLLPVVAEFTKIATIRGRPPPVSDQDLDLCFQAILLQLRIPLTSATRRVNSKIMGDTLGSCPASNLRLTQPDLTGLNSYAFAKLVVWLLKPNDKRSLVHLESLVTAVFTFCHPSNFGAWTPLIFSMLSEIATAWLRRVNSEEELEVPQDSRLPTTYSRKFVLMVRESIKFGVYSQDPLVFATSVGMCRILSLIDADAILPDILAEVYPTLQHGLHEPHRVVSALTCLPRLAVPLMSAPKYRMHITTLLELALVNLDPNESRRSLLTLALFQAIASVTKFEDISDDETVALAGQVLPNYVLSLEDDQVMDIAEDMADAAARGTTAAYPEILTQYMRRTFEVLETSVEPSVATAAPASVLRVLLASSPQIFNRLLDIALEEILNPQQQANDAFAQVCGAFVKANCKVAFPKLWSLLTTAIREEIEENQAGSGRTLLAKDSSLLRYLSVLNMCLLASNAQVLVDLGDELFALLKLLRDKTHVNVMYTVANTIHHAIVTLVDISLMSLRPGFGTHDVEGLSVKKASYLDICWNVPTEASRKLAIKLYERNLNRSEATIREYLAGTATNVNDRDRVSIAFVFIRTATGAISLLANDPEVKRLRERLAKLLLEVYPLIDRDDIANIKEILFVSKVWLCDVGYERTSQLDTHQAMLYAYEKRMYQQPGAHKRGFPPFILGRRALLYLNDCLALKTQYRDPDALSIELLEHVVLDACFSAYPNVRRNGFSALYAPLKIFCNRDLYLKVYSKALVSISTYIDSGEYDRAQGGFDLLSYRSLGLHTVCREPEKLYEYLTLVGQAAAIDHDKLSTSAAITFSSLLPDCFRLPVGQDPTDTEAWKYIEKIIAACSSSKLESLHWRQAQIRASTLVAISLCLRLPVKSSPLQTFLQALASISVHPQVRKACLQGTLQLMEHVFSYGLIGYDFSRFRADATTDETPTGSEPSHDESLIENDWSTFFGGAPVPSLKVRRTRARPTPRVVAVGSQGWLIEPTNGIWRAPQAPPRKLSFLSPADEAELSTAVREVITYDYWTMLFESRRLEPRPEEDRVKKQYSLLFRNLVTLSSMGHGVDIEKVLTTLVVNDKNIEDKHWHRAAAEFECGLLLAIPLLLDPAMVIYHFKRVFSAVLENISHVTIGYWLSALSYVYVSVDHRRLEPVTDLISCAARPESSVDGGGIKLALRTELYTEVIARVNWRKPSLHEVVERWPRWSHSLQATRNGASNQIAVASVGTLRIRWSSLLSAPQVKSQHSRLMLLSAQNEEALTRLFDIRTPHTGLSLLLLLLRSMQFLGGDACFGLIKSRGLPLLLEYTAMRDDPEVVVLVQNVFTEMGSLVFSPELLPTATKIIAQSMEASQWHRRMRILLLVQSFFFKHLLVFSSDARKCLAMLAADALRDPQVEVRELASDTLSGIVRCSPPNEQDAYREVLMKRLYKWLPNTTPLVDRHAAVLGLGALISAFPYSSPPPRWVPDVLATLAVKAASDSGVVGKSVKKILGDFKKTRQDTWHIDQTVFKPEQLDDLEGVLWKNYFA